MFKDPTRKGWVFLLKKVPLKFGYVKYFSYVSTVIEKHSYENTIRHPIRQSGNDNCQR